MEAERPAPEIVESAPGDLDLPGETGRQGRIFATWLACLLAAVILGSVVGAHISLDEEGTMRAKREMSRARAAKAKVALVVGLLVPGLLTWVINSRHRRGGAHARGITVDLTGDGELRIWGRGYGTRVPLAGAEITERLVDVYAGRLGAWRQRRLRVRGGTGGKEIEIATTARAADLREGLRVDGGEGDCVELGREDFDRIRERVVGGVSASRA